MPSDVTDPRQSDGGATSPEASGYVAEPGEQKIDSEKEWSLVKEADQEYDDARKFDENFRKQVAIDRKYAAGTSDLTWAVTTNLIGSFIDILTSMLYARDPDLSVRKSPQVDDNSPNAEQEQDFAKTLELTISRQWKRARLKSKIRKQVRSVLSVGEGWIKAVLISEEEPQPEIDAELTDARSTLARLEAVKKEIEEGSGDDPDETNNQIAEKNQLIETLKSKKQLKVKKGFHIDFIPAESIQMSLDVRQTEDYLEADWVANDIYITKKDAAARFPRLTEEDLSGADKFYQRVPRDLGTRDIDNVMPQGQLNAESAESFIQSTSSQESLPFVKVIERWNRRTGHVETWIPGVKKWAKEPFIPEYASSRYYPYFRCAFFEVDNERHPQSLSWRLYKLQDEFSAVRSNFRLTRERGIPGTIFDATAFSDEEAKKIADGKAQEIIPVRPTVPGTPLGNSFIPKPISMPSPALFDPSLVLQDMERMSGVQEALQAVTNAPKTATEASIQQTGFAARTTADRDNLEWMLTELAEYTAELDLQCLTIKDVQRVCGAKAFWPAKMAIEDIETLVEVSITAGSTGKPKGQADQQAWGVILPLLKETIVQCEQALAQGNMALYNALKALVSYTMQIMGDDMDVDEFIPQQPPTPPPQPPPGTVVPLQPPRRYGHKQEAVVAGPPPGGAPPMGPGIGPPGGMPIAPLPAPPIMPQSSVLPAPPPPAPLGR